jgi:cell division protein FtsL
MDGLQMGFIGQEAVNIVPEVVSVSNDHYSMQYAPVTALLVEAIKDQQKQIEDQRKEIDDLKSLVNSLITSQTGHGSE